MAVVLDAAATNTPSKDADTLDGHDSTYFATADHTQTLAKGGTGADLSTTGGANQVLKQSSTGATVTVGTLALTQCANAANNTWLAATDYAGTGTVYMFKVNASDQVELNGPIVLPGPITVAENSGAVTMIDMSVTSGAADGTEESYAVKVDATSVWKFYAESDGAGGVDGIKNVTYGDIEPVTTNSCSLGATTKAFKYLYLSDGTDEWRISIDTNGNLTATKV